MWNINDALFGSWQLVVTFSAAPLSVFTAKTPARGTHFESFQTKFLPTIATSISSLSDDDKAPLFWTLTDDNANVSLCPSILINLVSVCIKSYFDPLLLCQPALALLHSWLSNWHDGQVSNEAYPPIPSPCFCMKFVYVPVISELTLYVYYCPNGLFFVWNS